MFIWNIEKVIINKLSEERINERKQIKLLKFIKKNFKLIVYYVYVLTLKH